MMVRYKKQKISDTSQEYPFSWRLFCGWDHSITSESGTSDKYNSLRTNFKEQCREMQEEMKVKQNKGALYVARLFSNIIVLVLLTGSGAIIYYIEKENKYFGVPSEVENFINEYKLPFIIAVLKTVVPLVFEQLIKMEKWHPRVEVKWTLARTTLFYYASLGVLVYSEYSRVSSIQEETSQNITFGEAAKETLLNITTCWEAAVGYEIFKVVVLDIVACLLAVLCIDGLWSATVSCCQLKVSRREFGVTGGVLDLIYGQGLIWLGVYFSPLIPVLAVLKLFILFYYRYFMARYSNVPPKKLYKASRSGNFYLALLLTTLFLCLVPVGYAVLFITPSKKCGPFQGKAHVYDALTDKIGNLPGWLEILIEYVTSAVVVVPAILLLLLAIFYFKAQASSYRDVIADLRMQLHFERSEGKRKLLAAARNGENEKIKDTEFADIPQVLID